MKQKVQSKLAELGQKVPFEKAQLAQKVIQFISAIILIAASIVRFAYVTRIKSFAGIVLTIYLLIFAAIFICTELSLLRCRTWFYFLNFGWGKAFFSFFIACLCLGSAKAVIWLDILVGIYFLCLTLVLLLISMVYCGKEHEHVDNMLKQIEEQKAAKEA